jgi:hypothetical protein
METSDVNKKLQLMENRVRRLLFEEERANKLNRMAKEKAANMMYSRERHN